MRRPRDPIDSQLYHQPVMRLRAHPPRRVVVCRWMLLASLLVAGAGASFAPWVHRSPAALILTAPDLAEFVKFLPEVRDESLTLHRLFFLLPLVIVTLGLPPVMMAGGLAFPGWVRLPVLIVVIPLALTLLPPIWSPGVLLSAEFRLQTLACLTSIGLVVLSRWLRIIPTYVLAFLLFGGSTAAPALALWQFYKAREAIARVYASPIAAGWGAWIMVAGFVLAMVAGLLILWGRHPATRDDS